MPRVVVAGVYCGVFYRTLRVVIWPKIVSRHRECGGGLWNYVAATHAGEPREGASAPGALVERMGTILHVSRDNLQPSDLTLP